MCKNVMKYLTKTALFQIKFISAFLLYHTPVQQVVNAPCKLMPTANKLKNLQLLEEKKLGQLQTMFII